MIQHNLQAVTIVLKELYPPSLFLKSDWLADFFD